MSVVEWAEERSRALTIWDTGVLKVYCLLVGMIVGAYLAPFVRDNVTWFLVSVLLFGGAYGYRWFTAGTRHD